MRRLLTLFGSNGEVEVVMKKMYLHPLRSCSCGVFFLQFLCQVIRQIRRHCLVASCVPTDCGGVCSVLLFGEEPTIMNCVIPRRNSINSCLSLISSVHQKRMSLPPPTDCLLQEAHSVSSNFTTVNSDQCFLWFSRPCP